MKNIILLLFTFFAIHLQAQHQWDVIENIDYSFAEKIDSTTKYALINILYIGIPEKISFTLGDEKIILKEKDFKKKAKPYNDYPDTLQYTCFQIKRPTEKDSTLCILWNHRVAFASVKTNPYFKNMTLVSEFDSFVSQFISLDEKDENGIPILEEVLIELPDRLKVIYPQKENIHLK